jgi:hypothetical protein
MKRSVLSIAMALLTLSHLSAQSEGKSAEQAIIGTWKLVSYVREDVSSGAKSDVMGAHPSGYINYGPDGRMIVIIVGSDRKKPVGAVATPDEAAALIRSMLAYAGTYTIDKKAATVTHHIDVSWDQTRTGTDHVRTFRLEAKRLTLTTESSRDPASGQDSVRTLVWERLK